jgi:hypothetical protein
VTAHIDFMLFNVMTRRLLPSRRTASDISLVELQAANLGEGEDEGNLAYILGWHDAPETLWVNRDGEVTPLPDDGRVPPEHLPPY